MSVKKKPTLPLNGRLWATILGFFTVAAALLQLTLGAYFFIVLWALVTAGFGLFGFVVFGAYNFGSWVSLFFALGNVLVALYAKTLLGQSLGSHLYAPLDSFLALAATSGALLLALLLVHRLALGKPIFQPVRDPHFLAYLSWFCFILGALFWLLNRWFQTHGGGFGGVAIFRSLLLMAVVARTALVLERSGDRRALDIRLGLIIAASVAIGLFADHKTQAALPVVSYFATVLFYRRGLPLRSLIILIAGALIFIVIIAPMIHALRRMGQENMDLGGRVELVASNVTKLLENPSQLNRFQQLSANAFSHNNYYNYFGGTGRDQMLLGRYASVQQIDPVIAKVNQQSTLGGIAVWPSVERVVPSIIYPDKPKFSVAYQALVHYNLISPQGGKHPTLPLAGQAYAAYGVWGLLIIPFLTFFVFFLVMKKLGWNLYRNVYAIFFFCEFVIVHVNQGSLGQYAGAALRDFPLFAVVFWLISRSYLFRLLPIQHTRVGFTQPSGFALLSSRKDNS